MLKKSLADKAIKRGIGHAESGRDIEAIQSFKKAIDLSPDYDYAYYSLGIYFAKKGRFEESIDPFFKAVKINPLYREAFKALGQACSRIGRDREAVGAFQIAIQLNPDDAEAHGGLGLSYLLMKNLAGAVEEYDILKKIDSFWADRLGSAINSNGWPANQQNL
jgi:tetratricopeptide (TPR) repeat protein